ncbi:Neuropilin and tolloid-like protein 1 [Aphelenchoides fujianensis]|nr:Neuropilin and tolloid-like protein 1 [Aphelenchoides fujianensis]
MLSNQKRATSAAPSRRAGWNGWPNLRRPNHPSQYPPNVDCIRTIHAPAGYDILFRFHEVFKIETSYEDALSRPHSITPNCPNDYLWLQEIRDGRYSFSPLIGRFCGFLPPAGEIRVQSGHAWLNFHSDGLIEERGFSAEYEFVRKTTSISSLPPVLEEPECHFSYVLQLDGYINVSAMSSFYTAGRPVGRPLECIFQIRVPNWLRVAIFMEQFELAAPNQCSQNFLEIYAGPTARTPLKRYCGIIATHTYTSDSVVFLRAFVASAFHARNTRLRILFSSYLAEKNCSEHGLFECGDDICIPPSLACNGHANCIYNQDENQCNDCNSVLLNGYVLLVFLPIVMLCTVVVLAFVYRPWRPNDQPNDADSKEGTGEFSSSSLRFTSPFLQP